MREIMASPRSYFVRVSVFLATMALLGMMATTSGAAEGTTELMSVDSSGEPATLNSIDPSISASGRFVAFVSKAPNLVANDTDEWNDVFVRDRQSGNTELVSVDDSGNEGTRDGSYDPSISADGRYVAFQRVVDRFCCYVFVRDRQMGTTESVSVDKSGNQTSGYGPSISADGRFVAFVSRAPNLVANDTDEWNDVFVRDRQTGTTQRVSVDSSENQGNFHSGYPSISLNARFVTFVSGASNLVANDTNQRNDVFVRDRQTGTTERVSIGSSENQANGSSQSPSISSDGRYVAFYSLARNLVPNDTNGDYASDVFVRDRQEGTTQRVSVSSSEDQANRGSGSPSISPNGRFVAFPSPAANLVPGDTNDTRDVFVRDRRTGTTQRVSVSSSGNQANGSSGAPPNSVDGRFVSADGRFVAFQSSASNLVANDTNQHTDVFVHERDTTAPRVARVVLAEGANGVALKADVTATFSERMTKSTLTKANFELYKLIKNPNGTTSARQITDVTVTPSFDGLKATLNPHGGSDDLLAKNTRYKAVVSNGVLDVFGNPLDQNPSVSGNQPKVWYFKTRS